VGGLWRGGGGGVGGCVESRSGEGGFVGGGGGGGGRAFDFTAYSLQCVYSEMVMELERSES